MRAILCSACALPPRRRPRATPLGEKGWGYDTEGSRVITDLSTNSACGCLTSQIGRDVVFSTKYGRTRVTGERSASGRRARARRRCRRTPRAQQQQHVYQGTCAPQPRAHHSVRTTATCTPHATARAQHSTCTKARAHHSACTAPRAHHMRHSTCRTDPAATKKIGPFRGQIQRLSVG